jgi:uncharacterized protein with beta-barrel porin domain
MRRRLLAAVSLTALLGAPALAQDANVDDPRNEPVDTATAGDNNQPANLIIGASGRVQLTNVPGPAVTVNSDNTLTTETGSIIEIFDVNTDGEDLRLDGAVGVKVDPGVSTGISHGGQITLGDTYEAVASETNDPDGDQVDTDGDGVNDAPDAEADGAFADDRNKVGMLIGSLDGNYNPVAGQAPVTGDVTLEGASRITVQGQDSYGLRVASDLDGSITSNGRISIVGENSSAILIDGDVSGDVEVSRASVSAPGGNGLAVMGDVGGGVRLTGLISITGFRTDSRLVEELMRRFDDGDDNLGSGAAVVIAGNVVDGVFIATTGELRSATGGAATIEVGAGGETTTIGAVTLPDDFTETDDDDLPEALNQALVNRGGIISNGVFDGVATTAFLIGGRDDDGLLRAVILAGEGVRNEGNISSLSYDEQAVGVRLGEGAQAAAFSNTGTIEARAIFGYEGDGFADDRYGEASAVTLVLDEGSAIQRILNEGGQIIASVQANSTSSDGATAIKVDTDSLNVIENEGQIVARALSESATELVENTTPLIAIDARGHDGGLTVRQQQGLDDNGDPTSDVIGITGDVMFGDGDDTLELLAGELNGDVSFGLGADRLIINGATINGAISDQDADLTIDVTNGRLILTGADSLSLSDASFNDQAVLEIRIDTVNRQGAFVNASGAINFAQGSDLSVSLSGLIENIQDFTLITADTLTIDDGTILAATDAPFLYNAAITQAENDPNTLVISLSRKSAEALGMNESQAAAYDEAFATMTAITSLGDAFASLRTSEAFFGAYDQLLPEYAASAIQFALASNDAAAGALETRLRNARLSPDELAGVWIQEFGYFADRASTSFGPGYRGQGVGVAMGLDRPAGPFYAVGFHLVGAASEVEEIDGFDEPMVALSGQFGAYAAMDLGGIDISGSLGVGYDYFETERNIIVDSFSTTNTAEWSGWHIAAAANAGRDFGLGAWTFRPEAGLTWLSLFESGYTEQNEDPALSNLALIVDDRESSILTTGAKFTVARRFGTDFSWWSPSFHLGYRGELIGESTDTVARFGQDGAPFTLMSETLPGSGVLAGFGFSAGSQYTTFTFAYDADVRDQFVRHVARLVVRLTF